MFQCKHKHSIDAELSFMETGKIHGQRAEVDITRPVHICRDCRVLFAPIEEELAKVRGTIKNLR